MIARMWATYGENATLIDTIQGRWHCEHTYDGAAMGKRGGIVAGWCVAFIMRFKYPDALGSAPVLDTSTWVHAQSL